MPRARVRIKSLCPLLESLESRLLMSTWYVRPYGGSNIAYGAENGTSYENAWDGLSSVVWGSSGVKAGDTLYVCGTHPDPDYSFQYGGVSLSAQTTITVGASGTSDDQRVTIRGDYPSDPGTVIRANGEYSFDASNPSAGGWTLQTFNKGAYNFSYYTKTISSYSSSLLEWDFGSDSIRQLQHAGTDPVSDPSFWVRDGKVATAVGSGADEGYALAVQNDNKSIVGGYAFNGSNNDFALVRYNLDGTLDTSFGSAGKVITPIGAGDDQIRAIVIQKTWNSTTKVYDDTYIVAAGFSYNGSNYDFALARYTMSGVLDSTFGTGGKIVTPIGAGNDQAFAVAIQKYWDDSVSTNKHLVDTAIVVAGYCDAGGNTNVAVARYAIANGALDTSLDGDGKVTTSFGAGDSRANDLVLRRDSNGATTGIVVAGVFRSGGNENFAVARYTTAGALDTTFNGSGVVITPVSSGNDAANAVFMQGDGKILAAGYADNGGSTDFAVVRYNPNGTLDTTFGGDGMVTTSFGSGNDQANALTVRGDGKILVAGYAYNGADDDFALARYNSDGSLDWNFDGDGLYTSAIKAGNDRAQAVAFRSRAVVSGSSTYYEEDLALAAGFASNGSNNDFALGIYRIDDNIYTCDGVAYNVRNGTYYFKPRTGTSRSLIYMDDVYYGVLLYDKDYVTVKNITLHGAASSRAIVSLEQDSDHAILDGLVIKYAGYRGITADCSTARGSMLGDDFGEIKNCQISYCQSGIYFIGGTYRSSDWWIHDNTIENLYRDFHNINADNHGICLESGSNHVIENNVIRHVGTDGILIDLKEGSTDPALRGISNNIVIRYNWIEDVGIPWTHEAVQEVCLAVSSTVANHISDHSVNDKIYYNVLIGGELQAIRTTALGQPTPGAGDPWLLANNVAMNSGTRDLKPGELDYRPGEFYFYEDASWAGGFRFYNTILADNTKYDMFGAVGATSNPEYHDIDYNLYDADGSAKFYYGGSAGSFAVWQSTYGKDLHSPLPASPDFLDASGPDYDLHTSWDSPAIDAGTPWCPTYKITTYGGGPLIDLTDIDGKPIYGTPDIGAFEYQPPYTMGMDSIPANSSVRIYGDGKFRQLTAPGTTSASLSVTPAGGWGSFTATQQRPAWMDLAVVTWAISDDYARTWIETGAGLGSTATEHVIGGLKPNTNYNLTVNDVWGAGISGSAVAGGLIRSDASGQIAFNYGGGYASPMTFTLSKALWGDFNNDGLINAADIDAMMAQIRSGGNRAPFDLTLNGQVESADADNLVKTVLHSVYGDADLNSMVDQRDYAAWFKHNGQTSGWADGNFNVDTFVDQSDFMIWYNNNAFIAVVGSVSSGGGSPAMYSPGSSTPPILQVFSSPEVSTSGLSALSLAPLEASIADRQTPADSLGSSSLTTISPAFSQPATSQTTLFSRAVSPITLEFDALLGVEPLCLEF